MTAILGLGVAAPQYKMSQSDLAQLMAEALEFDATQSHQYQKIGANTAIDYRSSVLADFSNQLGEQKKFLGVTFPQPQPNLHQRNQRYQKEAPQLGIKAARNAMIDWGGDAKHITHVVVVSCTGVMVPGLDVSLVDALNLNPQVERFGIHFMGCFGALKGLALASALCKENPTHHVLVLCVELCSLHFQASDYQDTLLSNLLFADGAAAVIMSASANDNAQCKITKRQSFLLPHTRDTMSWDIGATALEMHMTRDTPNQIRNSIRPFVQELLDGDEIHSADFVIHPGGKAILHAVERACDLSKQQTQSSWEVLRNYGNMSSPTVLFILQRLLQQETVKPKIVMLGFGPGLTVEGMVLQYVA